jgi:hypothetical protein
MKKLILTSMIATVGLFAQNNGTAPAAPQKSDSATPAPATQTPAKKATHKHKKANNSGSSAAVKPSTTGKDSKAPVTPATPVPAQK